MSDKTYSVVDILREARSSHYFGAVRHFFAFTFLCFFPSWASLALVPLFSKPFHISQLIGRGELALYTAAIVAPALLIAWRERKTYSRKGVDLERTWMDIILVVLWVLSALFFAVVFASERELFQVNRIYMMVATSVLLAAALGLEYMAHLLKNVIENPDIGHRSKGKRNTLAKAVAGQQGEDNTPLPPSLKSRGPIDD
jgi:hypothetical protein